jgi:serine/threonine protein kinase
MCQRRHSFRVQGKLATPSFGELLLARRQDPEDYDALAPVSPRDTFQLPVAAEERVVVKRYWQQAGPALFDVALNELAVVTELRTMGTHPNVVRFFDAALIGPNSAVEEDRYVRLVMEFCEHGDLFSMLSAQPSTRVDEARALNIIAQVGSGLAFLHAHGVSHGNVSLENVLIDSTGCCKLADFRLSHTNTRSSDAGLHGPISDRVLGNMDYFTPERTPDATAKYDPIAEDIWALGVMLFMLMTGTPLMDRSAGRLLTVEAMRALECAGALRLWQLDHLLSPGATLLLSKLIAMDPSQRFQSVDEALRDPMLAGRFNRD